MRATYPTEADLTAKIQSTGVVDLGGCGFSLIDLAGKLDAAAEEWETKTGWTPYLAAQDDQGTGTPTTRLFDAPDGPVLRLRGGLLSAASVAVFDSDYAVGLDCFLQPSDAPARRKPFTEVRFLRRIASRLPQCVAVTGVWGYCLALDGRAREAILCRAAALCVPEIALNVSNGHYKIDDVQYAGGGITPLSAEKAMWDAAFAQAASDRKRFAC